MNTAQVIQEKTLLEKAIKTNLLNIMNDFIKKAGLKKSDSVKLDAGYDINYDGKGHSGTYANITINL